MDEQIRRAIVDIHQAPITAVVAIAGGGVVLLRWLLGTPGSTRTVLEARALNSHASMIEFIGSKPDQFVCEQTAQDMARSAYERALHLTEEKANVVGIGCTASIATDRSKRGQRRCYVAVWYSTGVTTYHLDLSENVKNRDIEEELVGALLLRALSEAANLPNVYIMPSTPFNRVRVDFMEYEDLIDAAVAGHVRYAVVEQDGQTRIGNSVVGAILPGSFDPLHQGHEELAVQASVMLGTTITFELSVTNVDKHPLDVDEVRWRVAQFAERWPVVITHAPIFEDKARMFPGCTFVIGADTALRLIDPRYYDGEDLSWLNSLSEMRTLGSRFLVAGRLVGGQYRKLDDIPIPEGFSDIFAPLPASTFRRDVSSTELRQSLPEV